jgi:hypothetical protein
VAGSCEHGSELLGSISGREFLNQLRNFQLLEKDSAPWRWFISVVSYNKDKI